jgi:hypothetical protein
MRHQPYIGARSRKGGTGFPSGQTHSVCPEIMRQQKNIP